MLQNTVDKDVANDASSVRSAPAVFRKIWLPKALYDVVPWFYVSAGLFALFATIYINHWIWIVPHYILFSAACLHIGLLIFKRRWAKTNKN